ncbi:MAG: 3-hydroxyacyl-ACP dehydratase FabZ [Spirochaetes bacterium]|nr:3-hydroxyacyl-ACP dehydratase FabZ [Spirochaetota bacterium]MCK5267337.1 3-hydroxyacyl-ACP dehydratase FabZ [Spirochaetota bacterium]
MGKQIDVNGVMDLIPHRYPFLLVDKILDWDEKNITGQKNVSINEPFFQGHFPGHPIMPGVLIVEGMAQCAGCLIFQNISDRHKKVVYFAGMDKVRFKAPVFPGDVITYKIEITRFNGRICKMSGSAFVDDKLVCSADMMAALVDKEESK